VQPLFSRTDSLFVHNVAHPRSIARLFTAFRMSALLAGLDEDSNRDVEQKDRTLSNGSWRPPFYEQADLNMPGSGQAVCDPPREYGSYRIKCGTSAGICRCMGGAIPCLF
jgi:hypothetical protein